MTSDYSDEQIRDERVTYTLQVDDRFFVIENVPARVPQRTGERFFSPETVERIQSIVWGQARRSAFSKRPCSSSLPKRPQVSAPPGPCSGDSIDQQSAPR